MKRSKKITTFIIIFFLIIALIIIGRYAMGLYFKKKFSKRPPPGVVVEIVSSKNFSQSLESYCTSLSSKTSSYKIKKNELLEPINFNSKVNKGDVIAKLSSKTIAAPFSGIIGKRGISGSSLGSENTIILTLDDSRKILCDLKIPETYAAILKKDLKLKAKFSAYKDKIYEGRVSKIMDFGAFVTILPGKDGLVHISEISKERVEKVTDVLKEGQIINVKVIEIDRQNRIRLSMKAIEES